MYDVQSLDMWLSMRIECLEMDLAILFEIKIEKKMDCGSLKNKLLDIINQILQAKSVKFEYTQEDVKLIKATINQNGVLAKDSRSAAVDQKTIPKREYELEDDMVINDYFDYINRYVICEIQKNLKEQLQESFHRRLTINTYTNNIVVNVFNMVQENLPCRGMRIETCNFSKLLKMKSIDDLVADTYKSKCCKCEII